MNYGMRLCGDQCLAGSFAGVPSRIRVAHGKHGTTSTMRSIKLGSDCLSNDRIHYPSHRDGKNLYRFSAGVETFPEQVEPESEPKKATHFVLADRNILADQAFNAFSAFEEDALVRIAPTR